MLEYCIEGIVSYGERVNRVIVISNRQLTRNGEWIPETAFPFSRERIASRILDADKNADYLRNPANRSGWILQQLFKLYAPLIVPGIAADVLVLDADTVFLKPTAFTDAEKGVLFTTSYEHHPPYFRHAERLIPGFEEHLQRSAIAHHMLFQRKVVQDLIAEVETCHQRPFWQAFCDCIDPEERFGSPCSEYEIYANFVLMRKYRSGIRRLKWMNIPDSENLERYRNAGYDFVSCHAYLRTPTA